MAKRLSDRAAQTRPRHTCKYCSKEFIHNPWSGQGKFCSAVCKTTGSRLTEEQKIERMKIYYDRDVIRKEGCWDWNGIKQNKSYGSIPQGRNKQILAHRASWLIHFGEIPKGMYICHHCDNPPCTNPHHLFLGTAKDNVHDMMKKGRKKNAIGLIPKNRKISQESAEEIRELLKEKATYRDIMAKYSVCKDTVIDIKFNRSYKTK